MKTFNDYLTDEFSNILENDKVKAIIDDNKLDVELLKQAYKILLEHKDDDNAKTQVENFIINKLKEKQQKNDTKVN